MTTWLSVVHGIRQAMQDQEEKSMKILCMVIEDGKSANASSMRCHPE